MVAWKRFGLSDGFMEGGFRGAGDEDEDEEDFEDTQGPQGTHGGVQEEEGACDENIDDAQWDEDFPA